MGAFKIGKVVLGSLFKKPATLMYPVVPREWQERTRGHIEIEETKCILCGMCMRKCPTDAITVDRKGRTWEIQRMQCVQCGCCSDVCPTKCLSMAQKYTEPGGQKVTDKFNVPEKEKKAAPKTDAAAKPAAAAKPETAKE
ncbi:MAG: 4Fe-4S binding protein [Anaerovoracaceae bacterium]|jgi:ech hydrogenase subunit F